MTDILLVLMKIWICQWNFQWRISNTRLDRMTCLHRRRTHQMSQQDPAETDRRLHLSKSLRRHVKMTVRIISFELGSVKKATHCRLFHVRLSSLEDSTLSQSRILFKFLRLILQKSSIISKQKIYSSLIILCWVNPYHRWNLPTFNERRKYLIS